MIALIQRVSEASISIAGDPVAVIGPGILALVGAEREDTPARARRLAERVLAYRIFPDADDRMNHSTITAGKAILAVPQFTLAADTRRGNRPGFSTACPPDQAEPLFDTFVGALRTRHAAVETGRFGANMQVSLVNDGPVTFWLSA